MRSTTSIGEIELATALNSIVIPEKQLYQLRQLHEALKVDANMLIVDGNDSERSRLLASQPEDLCRIRILRGKVDNPKLLLVDETR